MFFHTIINHTWHSVAAFIISLWAGVQTALEWFHFSVASGMLSYVLHLSGDTMLYLPLIMLKMKSCQIVYVLVWSLFQNNLVLILVTKGPSLSRLYQTLSCHSGDIVASVHFLQIYLLIITLSQNTDGLSKETWCQWICISFYNTSGSISYEEEQVASSQHISLEGRQSIFKWL